MKVAEMCLHDFKMFLQGFGSGMKLAKMAKRCGLLGFFRFFFLSF